MSWQRDTLEIKGWVYSVKRRVIVNAANAGFYRYKLIGTRWMFQVVVATNYERKHKLFGRNKTDSGKTKVFVPVYSCLWCVCSIQLFTICVGVKQTNLHWTNSHQPQSSSDTAGRMN